MQTGISNLLTCSAKAIRVLLLFSLLPLLSTAAQVRQAPSVTADRSAQSDDDQHAPGSIEEEMRAKRAIKFAEEEHKENLERAHEVSELGSKLQSSFLVKKSLDKDDNKRIDRLEKLTRQLRSKAGGSDTDIKIEHPPQDLTAAVALVAKSSDSLSCLVQKTPRQVVSTAVIDEANVLLQLIEILRQLSH